MIEEYAKTAWTDIRNRKKRSWLTMIGIIIGIAAVVSLVSLGQGLEDAFTEQFEMFGTNTIMVLGGGSIASSTGGGLTTSDVELIRDVRGVDQAAPMLSKVSRVEFGGESRFVFVSGLPQDESKEVMSNIQSFQIDEGRDLNDGDRYSVVVGSRVAGGELFGEKVRIGNIIKINSRKFKVVGVMNRIGNPDDDSQMFIPLETARDLFNEPDEVYTIIVTTKTGFDVSKVAEDIKKAMRRDRDQDPGEEDFTVQTTEQLMESFSTILDLVQYVLIGIASISLLVGGIGIMNTMYTSVLERTRDIGVMKSIGARNSDIMSIFLIESGLIGMSGGLIGAIIGFSISKGIELAATSYLGVDYLKASVTPMLFFGALGFSFFVGMVSGTSPAIRASKLKPTEALRYE